MGVPSALKSLEELLGLETMRVRIHIVFDPKERKMRARAQNVWVRFPNNLRAEGAEFEAEVKRGKGDHFITVGPIVAINAIALQAKRFAS